MKSKRDFAPEFWRKRAEETRKLAELVEDGTVVNKLMDIAVQYEQLSEFVSKVGQKEAPEGDLI
jgi:hypothetical protein